jgi:hypothetical protein
MEDVLVLEEEESGGSKNIESTLFSSDFGTNDETDGSQFRTFEIIVIVASIVLLLGLGLGCFFGILALPTSTHLERQHYSKLLPSVTKKKRKTFDEGRVVQAIVKIRLHQTEDNSSP